MFKLNKLVEVILVAALPSCVLFAQDGKPRKNSDSQIEQGSVNSLNSVGKISIIKKEESRINSLGNELYGFQYFNQQNNSKSTEPDFDVVSSFRSNIRFGGFWDKYTIINLTPEMQIKPADFISVYAIHNTSYFVPIDGIKQNFRSMAIRSAAVMIVDNSMKMLMSSSKIIGPVIGFLAKNLLIYAVDKFEKESDAKNNLLNYDYHYYSVSIRF